MAYKLDDAKWKYVAFAENWSSQDGGTEEEQKNADALGASWLIMVKMIARTRCLVCECHGHSSRVCPSHRRLVNMAGGAGLYKTIRNNTA